MSDDALIAGAAAPVAQRWIRSTAVLDAGWVVVTSIALVVSSFFALIDLPNQTLRTGSAPLRVFVLGLPVIAIVIAVVGAARQSVAVASMESTTASRYQGFDGVWFDDIVITGTGGTYREQAWDFRNAMGYRSPGMTVRVIRENTTTSSLGFIGDSVGNGITASNGEFRQVTDGTFESLAVDAVDSRCTNRTSCNGTTGVDAAKELPNGLDVVLVELGYNDDPATFDADIDAMMKVLTAKNVGQVAWVNMADIRRSNGKSTYRASNTALAAAAKRWRDLTVLDWNNASDTADRSRWFSSDGVHLSSTGEAEFALWLRSELLDLAPSSSPATSSYLTPPRRIELRVVGSSMTSVSGDTVRVPRNAAAVSARPVPRLGHALTALGLVLAAILLVTTFVGNSGWSSASVGQTSMLLTVACVVLAAGMTRTVPAVLLACAACVGQVVAVLVVKAEQSTVAFGSDLVLRTGVAGIVALAVTAAVSVVAAMRTAVDAEPVSDVEGTESWRWHADD